jgi:aspartyl-tRNA(Asn)/glutamyl-tRNA(Gln) amidotransferase subunit C
MRSRRGSSPYHDGAQPFESTAAVRQGTGWGLRTTVSRNYDLAVPTRLTPAEVERIAALAHLELTAPETERLTQELGDILAYFDQLQHVDTTGVPATTNPVTSVPVMREDHPRPSMSQTAALVDAPDPSANGLFRVPKVLG